MKQEIEMMEAFHKAFNHPMGGGEGRSLKNLSLRAVLINEEAAELESELWDALQQGKISPNLLKEGADLLYVILGTFVSLGLGNQLVEAFKRVHESNMSKLDENGKPLYREDGKVMKGPNYKPPNLEDLV
jgi:NTP pyrophosphatase (non-canonical NTP hydrolase)